MLPFLVIPFLSGTPVSGTQDTYMECVRYNAAFHNVDSKRTFTMYECIHQQSRNVAHNVDNTISKHVM